MRLFPAVLPARALTVEFASHTVCCMVLAAALAIGGMQDAAAGAAPPQVTVARPIVKSVPHWDEYIGRFEPLQQVEVRPRVSGAIDTIAFTDGQIVKKGDLLFVIDPRPYQIAVDSAKAEVLKNRAQVDVAARDVTRSEQLVEGRVITTRDIDQRKGTLDVAKAEQLAAEAALRNAELNLEWTQVRAPISGRLSDHRVDVGNLVQAGTSLLTTIVTLDPIHFEFDASEADYIRYARLASGAREFKNPVMVRLADETDWSRSHAGTMDFIDNRLNGRSGTIRGRAILENKDLFLVPGTFGYLRLFGGDAEALLIPDATIASDQASKVVLTVGADNIVVPKTVTLGPIHEGLRVVLSGLSRDARVVIAGVANPFVRAGAKVEPREGTITLAANSDSSAPN